MPATTDPNLGLHYGFTYRESGWGDAYNADMKALGALVQLSVLSATTAAQPSSPAEGDRYIVPSSATGADWTGQAGKIALYQDARWMFYTPAPGWRAYIADALKQGETTGNGTGIPAYFSNDSWLVIGTDTPVQA